MPKNIEPDDFNEDQFFKPVPTPAVTSGNPLADYFRMPGLHVKLPTGGAFLPPEDFDATLTDDVPVFPMKASDEILLRSPDALMSGHALESLISSCVPAIRTPRSISMPDLDVLLLAIRAATYGDNMEIEVNCPECSHENTFDCHLPTIMADMKMVDPVNEVELSKDVKVLLRPYTLGVATKVANGSFNEARTLQLAQNEAGEDEDRFAQVRNESYARMTKLNLQAISSCIISVAIPGKVVTDPTDIFEFINNTNQAWVKKIEKKVDEINSLGINKSVDAKCSKCNHEWSAEIEFDPTSFFGEGS